MTPPARYAAAISILQHVFDGDPAEKVLTTWARKNRYAGSKDRAAIRDIVFDCLRCKNSFAQRAGQASARGVVIGQLLANDIDASTIFNGDRYAPSVLADDEIALINTSETKLICDDVPDWMQPLLKQSLGDDYGANMHALCQRAPIDLRVNIARISRDQVLQRLREEGVETTPIDGVATALRVNGVTRKIPQTNLYKDGLIELQDAASQGVIDLCPFESSKSVLDYCAGGGGKSLGIAAKYPAMQIDAYDLSQPRLLALQERASRAGAKITLLKTDPSTQDKHYDTVMLDVPCSGSGAWRRNPEGKWTLTQDKLRDLCETQAQILSDTNKLVAAGGCLIYITCSLFACENDDQIDNFLDKNPDYQLDFKHQFTLTDIGDGFFVAVLART